MMKKVCIAAMGPGETSQAVAFATYLSEHNVRVAFALQFENTIPFVKTAALAQATATHTPDYESLTNWLAQEKPDAFVMCNSKMFNRNEAFHRSRPTQAPIFSIDSNWLFSTAPDTAFKFAPWIDMYLINIPEKVFHLGLSAEGGAYQIPDEIMKKIRVVGLIPSYRKISAATIQDVRTQYGIGDDEKMIFSYGGSGVTTLSESIQKLFPAVSELIHSGRKIKVLFAGPLTSIAEEYRTAPWLIHRDSLDATHYYESLASADLVYQHQGLGTLAQAIAAEIPTIANVVLPPATKVEHTHDWEVRPFVRAGACSMFYFDEPIASRVKEIEALLYNENRRSEMRARQKELYNNGEEEALRVITDYVNQ